MNIANQIRDYLHSLRLAVGACDSRRGTDTVTSLLQAILCALAPGGTPTTTRTLLCSSIDGRPVFLAPNGIDLLELDGVTLVNDGSIGVACSTPFESDPMPYCDNGFGFIRWSVKDGQGQPVGVFDTLVDGLTLYTPSGFEIPGICTDPELITSDEYFRVTNDTGAVGYTTGDILRRVFAKDYQANTILNPLNAEIWFNYSAPGTWGTALSVNTNGSLLLGTPPLPAHLVPWILPVGVTMGGQVISAAGLTTLPGPYRSIKFTVLGGTYRIGGVDCASGSNLEVTEYPPLSNRDVYTNIDVIGISPGSVAVQYTI